jgi:O-antigen/teichoic acid export membrane protein
MLGQIRKLGKQTAVYGLGSILNKMLGFLLIPIYNKFIPIGDFGDLAVMEITILFLTSVLHFGIFSGHQRYFFLEKEENNYGAFLFNNYAGNIILTLVSILPFFIFSSRLSQLFYGNFSQTENLKIVFGIIIAEILCVVPFQILQFEEKPVRYLLLNAFKLIFSFFLTRYFVRDLSMGIEGILYARLTGAASTALISLLFIIIPRLKIKWDLSLLWLSIKFGLPAIAGNIGYLIFQMNDRYMLNWLSNPMETGKYSFGYKIANFINLIFVSTIGLSYMPSIFSKEKEENNTRYYRKMLTYYCFLIAFIILGFLFFYKDLLALVAKNKEYWEGLAVVPVLSLSFMVMGMNYFVGIGLYLNNKMHHFIIPSLVAVVLNILMNWFFIPRWGMMGAAYSTLCSQILYTAILTLTAGKQIKIGFEWVKILLIYFLAIALYMGDQMTSTLNIFLAYAIRLALLAIFPVVLYKLNFFEKIEIIRLREGISKVFDRYSPW